MFGERESLKHGSYLGPQEQSVIDDVPAHCNAWLSRSLRAMEMMRPESLLLRHSRRKIQGCNQALEIKGWR